MAPKLEAIYTALNAGKAEGAFPIGWREVGPPLPRTYRADAPVELKPR